MVMLVSNLASILVGRQDTHPTRPMIVCEALPVELLSTVLLKLLNGRIDCDRLRRNYTVSA
jgi:hypothetical protein